MYWRRLWEIKRQRIRVDSFATTATGNGQLKNVSAADNFSNLLEAPMLFYVVGIVLHVTQTVSHLQLTLAWLYVGLRTLHSLIHVTYNRVEHRFFVYVVSSMVLAAMWFCFALSLI